MRIEKTVKENSYEVRHLTTNDLRDLLKNNVRVIVSNINKIMNENKITQMELAGAIHSEQRHISYILRQAPIDCEVFHPNKGITINILGRIAAALNTSISELSKKS